MRRTSKPTVVDLFAGAGLFSHAFAVEGFTIVQAIEANRDATATYALNLGSDHLVHADITKVAPSVPCDVLVAGPPCQGFSTLGARRLDDPRNKLSMEVVRFAKILNPSIVVIENVEAFLHSEVHLRVRRAFARLGYGVLSYVLDAVDFGVPQYRARSFTVATRQSALPLEGLRKRRVARTVQDAFAGLPAEPDGNNFHYSPRPSALALARMKLIPPGGDRRDVLQRAPELSPPSWHRPRSEMTDVWGRMRWDSPSNTLRTALQNPSKGRYIHPDQNRVISLREAARLQTIPDSWVFAGPPYPVAMQIGNSVPPSLGRTVARAVLRALG